MSKWANSLFFSFLICGGTSLIFRAYLPHDIDRIPAERAQIVLGALRPRLATFRADAQRALHSVITKPKSPNAERNVSTFGPA